MGEKKDGELVYTLELQGKIVNKSKHEYTPEEMEEIVKEIEEGFKASFSQKKENIRINATAKFEFSEEGAVSENDHVIYLEDGSELPGVGGRAPPLCQDSCRALGERILIGLCLGVGSAGRSVKRV